MYFFLPMIPPTTTHQMKKVSVRNGKPHFYEDEKLATARAKLESRVGPYRPEAPYGGAVRLVTKWLFPVSDGHEDGEYKTTPPDTDNLQKLLKDVMTTCKFWTDDAIVASEVVEKFYANQPGIFIAIEELSPVQDGN